MPTNYWWDNALQDSVRFQALERLDLVDANALQRMVFKYMEEAVGGLMGAGSGCLTRPWVTYEYPKGGGNQGPYYIHIGPFQMYYQYDARRPDGSSVKVAPPTGSALKGSGWVFGADPNLTNSFDEAVPGGPEYTNVFNGTHYMPTTHDYAAHRRGMILSHDPEDGIQQGHSKIDITQVLQQLNSAWNGANSPKTWYLWARPALVEADTDARREWDVTTGSEKPVSIKTRYRTRVEFTLAQTEPAPFTDENGFPTTPPWKRIGLISEGMYIDMTFTAGDGFAPIDPDVMWISAFDEKDNFEWTGEFGGTVSGEFGDWQDNANASNLLHKGGGGEAWYNATGWSKNKDLGLVRLTHLIRRQLRMIQFGHSPGKDVWYGSISKSLWYISKWMDAVWMDWDGQEGNENSPDGGPGSSIDHEYDSGILPNMAASWAQFIPWDPRFTINGNPGGGTADGTNLIHPQAYIHAMGTLVYQPGGDGEVAFNGFGLEVKNITKSVVYSDNGSQHVPFATTFELKEKAGDYEAQVSPNAVDTVGDGYHTPFEILAIQVTPLVDSKMWTGGSAIVDEGEVSGHTWLKHPTHTADYNNSADMEWRKKAYKGLWEKYSSQPFNVHAVGTPHAVFPVYGNNGSYNHKAFQIRMISHPIGPPLSQAWHHISQAEWADELGLTPQKKPTGATTPAHIETYPMDGSRLKKVLTRIFGATADTEGNFPASRNMWLHDAGQTQGSSGHFPWSMLPLCSVVVWCKREK